MKICVSSKGSTLDAQVDPRFGRCPYFIFVDPDNLTFEAMKNPNIDATGGAGIQSGQLMTSKQVDVVLTGKVGPNALQTLQAAGIDVITSAEGTVQEAIGAYKKKLSVERGPSFISKTDKKRDTKRKEVVDMPLRKGIGIGQGRGMGRGRGAGPGGYCVCISCGEKVTHEPGVPCNAVNCPKCGARMIRE